MNTRADEQTADGRKAPRFTRDGDQRQLCTKRKTRIKPRDGWPQSDKAQRGIDIMAKLNSQTAAERI